jgi:hypothetical protein
MLMLLNPYLFIYWVHALSLQPDNSVPVVIDPAAVVFVAAPIVPQ